MTPLLAAKVAAAYKNIMPVKSTNELRLDSFLIDDIMTQIDDSSESQSDRYKPLWDAYEGSGVLYSVMTGTKANEYVDPDFYEVVDEMYCMEWQKQGFNLYYLYQLPVDMPLQVYESFCSTASDVVPDMYGYPYMQCCLILERNVSTLTTKGPLIQSHWSQGYPFNTSDPNSRNLGCVTIAVGQLMKYYRHPSSYDWDSMRGDLFVTDSGGSSGFFANLYLSTHGYHSQRVNHSYSGVYGMLYNNQPVYMEGDDSNGDGGHAWLCDGYMDSTITKEYWLVIPVFENGRLDYLELFDQYLGISSEYIYYHMNWGWGGISDGYYYYPIPTNQHYNFNINMKDIYAYPRN